MDERPSFFMVFIPQSCSQRMQIPPAYAVKYMRDQGKENATFLRDCGGNIWPVEISVEGRAFFFDKGWVRFVEDNHIDLGDFLVFKLSSDDRFDFKHFGNSACEKEKTSSFRFTVKTEEFELGEEESKDDNAEEEEEVNAEEEENDGEYVEGEEPDDKEDNRKFKDNRKNEEEEEKKEQGYMHAGSKRKRLKRSDIDMFEDEIFGSGVVPIPKNPYFVVKIRPQKRQELFIPVDVVRDHGLKLPSEMDIVDEKRKRWPSKVKVWSVGRIVLKKGWKAFCKWNHVKTDDKCLFEFVRDKKNKGKLCLQVRIYCA